MRWQIAFMIMVWFLQMSAGSESSSRCPVFFDVISPGSDICWLTKEIAGMKQDCLEKNDKEYEISTCWLCLSCQSGSCCTSIPCVCVVSNLDICLSLVCSSVFIPQNCLREGYIKYTCPTNFYQTSSVESRNGCSNEKNIGGVFFVLQLNAEPHEAHDGGNEGSDTAVWQIMCNSNSVTSNAPSINTTIESRTTTTIAPSTVTTNATSEDWSATTSTGAISRTPISEQNGVILGIGVGVGVGGGILLAIAIVLVVVLRRRRSESNKLHAKDASQVDAAVACETPSTNYTIPVPAAYDNAVNGTSLSYQAIVYDNENVNALNHEYSEVRKPKAMNNDGFYDNSETGRNEDEMAKDYDNASEDPAANSETIVIDNEFYG